MSLGFRSLALVAAVSVTAGITLAGAPSSNAAPAPAVCSERSEGGPQVAFGLTPGRFTLKQMSR